jgi:hypothetical protein
VTGQLLGYGANFVRARVDAPAEGLVVLNEVDAPGWSVRIDGRPAEPVRANWVLRGVVVPAGVHDLLWEYAPRDYGAWLALWGAGLAFVLAAGVSGLRIRAMSEDMKELYEAEERGEDEDEGYDRWYVE